MSSNIYSIKQELNNLIWTNDLDKKPEVKEQLDTPHKALEYLSLHKEAFGQAPNETEKLIDTLFATDLSKTEMSETDWKTMKSIAGLYPNLFEKFDERSPTINLSMNNVKITFPKNLLLWKFSTFRKMFEVESKEVQSNQIDFKLEGFSEESFNEVCKFFKTGDINVTNENAFELIQFGEAYGIDDLESAAESFLLRCLLSKISTEDCLTILNGAIQLNCREVIRNFIKLHVSGKFALPKLITEAKNFPETSQFLIDLENLKEALTTDSHTLVIKLKVLNPSDSLIEAFNGINFDGKMFTLDLSLIKDINNEQLKRIMNQFYKTKELIITSQNISELEIKQELIELRCLKCPNLKSLNLPNTERVVCIDFPNLISLNLPKTIRVTLQSCPNLISLSLPEANIINLKHCDNLSSLKSPKATFIDKMNCPQLQDNNLSRPANCVVVGR